MEYESLRASCIADLEALAPFSAEAAAAYKAKGLSMAAEVTRQLAGRPDIDRLIGEGNQAMMEDNHNNHARYVASVLEHMVAEQVVDTILWVFRAYRAHGFYLTYWPAQLNAWLSVMQRELSQEAQREIEPFYLWMLRHKASFATLSEHCVTPWETPRHSDGG